jgi:fibronectin-binding autotransporter adhesin
MKKVSLSPTAGILALVAFPVAFPLPALAIDYNWVANPGNGNWSDTSNWVGGVVPLSGGGNSILIHTPGSINIAGVALDAGFLNLAVGNAGAPTSGYTFGAGTYNIGTLYVGENHSGTNLNNGYGRAFINAGTTVNVNAFHLGEWDGASGHVIQSGGDVNVAGQFRLGHWPQAGGAANSYALNGGNFTMATITNTGSGEGAAGNFILGIDSSGTFTVNAGTLTVNGVTMQTRGAGGGESFLVLNGGTVNVGPNGMNTSNPGTLGSYDLQFGGGTIRSTASWASNLETHLISGGTGIHYDTNGFNVALSGVLNGAGGLAKDGAGTLTLSNGANSYTGATTINGGTLQITAAGAASTSNVVVKNGGILQLDSASKTLQALSIESGATLTISGGTGLTNTITNALDFNGSPNFTVKPSLLAPPSVGATFDLFTAGSVTGAPGTIVTDFGLSHTSGSTALVGNKLVLTIATAGGLLTWSNGAGTGNWVTNADVNFVGADGKFLNGDQVTFGTTAAGTVNLVGALVPAGVIVNSTADYTFSGPGAITGATALTKSGTSTLTVSTINTYTGGTTVNEGVMHLTAQNGGEGTIRGTVTVNAGAELRASGGGAVFGYTNGVKLDTFNINGGLVNATGPGEHIWNATVNMTGGELRTNNGVSTTSGNAFQWGNSALNTLASPNTATVSGRIQIRVDAGNTLNINTADGAAALDLLVSAGITESGGSHIVKNGAGAAELSGGAVISGTLRTNGGALTLSGASPYSANQVLFTNGGSVSLTNGATLSVNDASFGIGGQNETVGGTLNVGLGTTFNSVIARLGDSGGGGSLTQATLNQTGGIVNITAPDTDGRNFVLGHWNATQGIYNQSGGTLNSPNISMAISWDGDGTYSLSGGTANVLGLRFGHNGGRSGVFNLTGGELNLGAQGIWEQNAGLPNDINLGGGTVRAAVNTTISVPTELTGTNGDTVFDTNGNTLTVTGAITGAGGFSKTGSGRMVLNAPNSAAGIISVNQGTLALVGDQTANRLAAGGLVQINNGGTLEFASTNAPNFTANYTIAAGGTVTSAAGVGHTHLGGLNLTGGTLTTDPGAASYHGENYVLDSNVTVTGVNPSTITHQGGSAADRGIGWVGNRTFNVATVSTLNVSTELENTDTGEATLVKTGNGRLNLTFPASYTGATNINGGKVVVSGAGALADVTAVNINSGSGVLDIGGISGTTEKVASLSGVGNSTVKLGTKTLEFGDANNTTFSGVFDNTTLAASGSGGPAGAGTGSITKVGSGTFTMDGMTTSTYTGATNLQGGTLLLANSDLLPDTADFNLGAGTTLSTGGYSDATGSASLLGNAIIDLGGAGGVSALTFTDIGTWSGVLSVWHWSGSVHTAGVPGTDSQLIFAVNTFSRDLSSVQFYSDGGMTPVGVGAGFIGSELVAVPEPGALSLWGLLMTVIGLRRSRK